MDEIKRFFNAPVPGQSLTKAPGALPFEQPAEYSDPNAALEFVWDSLKSTEQSTKIVELLKVGHETDRPALSVQGLAKTLVTGGFAEGKWSPDTALLMEPVVMAQIAAVAKDAGLEEFNTYLPTQRDSFTSFMKEINQLRGSEDDVEVFSDSSGDTVSAGEGQDTISGGEGSSLDFLNDPRLSSSPVREIFEKPTFGGLAAFGMEKDLIKSIKDHEGVRNAAYDDATGKPITKSSGKRGNVTVGVGFNMDDQTSRELWERAEIKEDFDSVYSGSQKLSKESVDKLLQTSLAVSEDTVNKLVEDINSHPDDVRNVVRELAFQLGETRLRKFKNTLKAINAKDYDKASKELIDSRLTRKRNPRVPKGVEERTKKLARILKDNVG
jgi:GH24 family phage-related lysozyme (muramidase)